MNGIHGFGGWAIFGMLFQIAIIIGVVYLIVYLYQSTSRRDNNNLNDHHGQKTNLEILEERYVRGEIDEEEFIQKKRLLIVSIIK
ncbi:SHOCT domain-containing protein [Anaerobacillus sp. MEB173]|uniref:SHOCT domain-containing protein n=1 Tax=Anaerobacillus sp. MEB173 TaxID=3383345 RepID=UPI003F939BB5